MTKTVLHVKTDSVLKTQAQKTAKAMGLPLSVVVNSYLRNFVQDKQIVFSVPPIPNKQTQKNINEVRNDIQERKNAKGPFTTRNEIQGYLDSLKE